MRDPAEDHTEGGQRRPKADLLWEPLAGRDLGGDVIPVVARYNMHVQVEDHLLCRRTCHQCRAAVTGCVHRATAACHVALPLLLHDTCS